jgi:hypothetical protein
LYSTTNNRVLESTGVNLGTGRDIVPRFTDVAQSASKIQPQVEARSGGLFSVFAVAASFLLLLSALAWAGSIAIKDTAGATGGLAFTLLSSALLAAATISSRNICFFANTDVIGVVGPLGGMRTCSRAEFADLRVVRDRDWLGASIWWRLPRLQVRRRNGTDAFVTSAYLYQRNGLREVARYLGVPLDLSHPVPDVL